MVIGRFAPSPTGPLHLGNARTALLAWLHVRAVGGRFLLRFEDLDAGRVRPGAFELTRRDLAWLGLTWDQEYIQSQRLFLYQQALAALPTYRCTCTRKSVAEAAAAPHGKETVYPGTCRDKRFTSGAVRWRVPDKTVCAHDLRLGQLCQDLPAQVGDFVLQRADGAYAYHLAAVVDDADMKVTDVLRGEDLWPSTPRQVALQRALKLPTPRYLHVPLMTDFAGRRLAKRGGAPSVADFRENGDHPQRLLAQLASSLGWTMPDEVSMDDLLQLWRENLDDLSKFLSAAPPRPPLT